MKRKSLKKTTKRIAENAETALRLNRIVRTIKNANSFNMTAYERDVLTRGIIMQLEEIAGACTEIWWAARDLESFAEGNQPAKEAEKDN